MLYNDIITYNQSQVSYNGTLVINVAGQENPIILNSVTVFVGAEPDYSNATTIGLVTVDLRPTGIISIGATDEQAYAIASSSSIYLIPSSETQSTGSIQDFAEGGSATVAILTTAEISIENT